MTTREQVQKMLDVEVRIIDRQKKEVTYDRPQETAQVRKDCIDEILQLFEPLPQEVA